MKTAIKLSKKSLFLRKLFYTFFKNNKEVYLVEWKPLFGKLKYPELTSHSVIRTDKEGAYILGFDYTTEEFVHWEKTIPSSIVFFLVITLFYSLVMVAR